MGAHWDEIVFDHVADRKMQLIQWPYSVIIWQLNTHRFPCHFFPWKLQLLSSQKGLPVGTLFVVYRLTHLSLPRFLLSQHQAIVNLQLGLYSWLLVDFTLNRWVKLVFLFLFEVEKAWANESSEGLASAERRLKRWDSFGAAFPCILHKAN